MDIINRAIPVLAVKIVTMLIVKIIYIIYEQAVVFIFIVIATTFRPFCPILHQFVDLYLLSVGNVKDIKIATTSTTMHGHDKQQSSSGSYGLRLKVSLRFLPLDKSLVD